MLKTKPARLFSVRVIFMKIYQHRRDRMSRICTLSVQKQL